jgi:hypothetical protein
MEELHVLHRWAANIFIINAMAATIIWVLYRSEPDKLKTPVYGRLISGENVFSSLILFLGAIILVKNTIWFSIPKFHPKLTLGLIAIAMVHVIRMKTSAYLDGKLKYKLWVDILRPLQLAILGMVYFIGYYLTHS